MIDIKQTRIETPRLLLRPWRIEDAPDLYAYAKDPDVGPMAGFAPHRSLEESRAIAKRFTEMENGVCLAVVLKETGHVIGSMGLGPDARHIQVPGCVHVGYSIGKAYWGRGLMPEAVHNALDHIFRIWKIRIATITHYPENHRSRRVIEKSGFRFEGVLRQCALRYNGAVTDLWFYSMTAAEYYTLRAGELGLRLALPEEFPVEQLEEYRRGWGAEKIVPGAMRSPVPYDFNWVQQQIAKRTYPVPGYVPSTLYLLTDADHRILGALDLRHELVGKLLTVDGHIGYGVHPSERGKGLAPLLLGLGLEKAKELGIRQVLVTCNDDNPASAATIRDCGGVLEKLVAEANGNLVRRYWIYL